MSKKWIGVDLDGTLAYYDGWKGPQHIGDPVPAMLARVKRWIEDGMLVKVFTARASTPSQIPPILEWLKKNGLDNLEITCIKDRFMVELWDDRCVPVLKNTGEPMMHPQIILNRIEVPRTEPAQDPQPEIPDTDYPVSLSELSAMMEKK